MMALQPMNCWKNITTHPMVNRLSEALFENKDEYSARYRDTPVLPGYRSRPYVSSKRTSALMARYSRHRASDSTSTRRIHARASSALSSFCRMRKYLGDSG